MTATKNSGTDGIDPVNGRYRDEVAYNDDRNIFLVRRTFLSSKVEFEVEVPNAGLGKSIEEMNRLSTAERDQLVIDTAQGVLDLRTRQLSEDLDNSDLGGEELVRPVGGGVFNPANPYAPRAPLGFPAEALKGTPNDRTATAGTAKSAETVRRAVDGTVADDTAEAQRAANIRAEIAAGTLSEADQRLTTL